MISMADNKAKSATVERFGHALQAATTAMCKKSDNKNCVALVALVAILCSLFAYAQVTSDILVTEDIVFSYELSEEKDKRSLTLNCSVKHGADAVLYIHLFNDTTERLNIASILHNSSNITLGNAQFIFCEGSKEDGETPSLNVSLVTPHFYRPQMIFTCEIAITDEEANHKQISEKLTIPRSSGAQVSPFLFVLLMTCTYLMFVA